MICLRGIGKTYREKSGEKHVIFRGLDFCSSDEERSVAILGRSGSGKTTLLRIIAGIDVDYEGEYLFDEKRLKRNASAMAHLRREVLGVVPQDAMVLEDRSVLANVELGVPKGVDKKRTAQECLEKVGLLACARTSAAKLSGGEAQRVAVARAIAKRPRLLLADEPTAALDEKTEGELLSLFERLVADGTRIIIATHNQTVADWCDAKFEIRDCALVRL